MDPLNYNKTIALITRREDEVPVRVIDWDNQPTFPDIQWYEVTKTRRVVSNRLFVISLPLIGMCLYTFFRFTAKPIIKWAASISIWLITQSVVLVIYFLDNAKPSWRDPDRCRELRNRVMRQCAQNILPYQELSKYKESVLRKEEIQILIESDLRKLNYRDFTAKHSNAVKFLDEQNKQLLAINFKDSVKKDVQEMNYKLFVENYSQDVLELLDEESKKVLKPKYLEFLNDSPLGLNEMTKEKASQQLEVTYEDLAGLAIKKAKQLQESNQNSEEKEIFPKFVEKHGKEAIQFLPVAGMSMMVFIKFINNFVRYLNHLKDIEGVNVATTYYYTHLPSFNKQQQDVLKTYLFHCPWLSHKL